MTAFSTNADVLQREPELAHHLHLAEHPQAARVVLWSLGVADPALVLDAQGLRPSCLSLVLSRLYKRLALATDRHDFAQKAVQYRRDYERALGRMRVWLRHPDGSLGYRAAADPAVDLFWEALGPDDSDEFVLNA
jgi:hypothetical protein